MEKDIELNELSRLVSIRTEKLSIKLRMVEERQEAFIEDTQKKLSALAIRSVDRPRIEAKIEEMIERHNQVVRSFENRLNQLKRIVENQEVELLRASADLSDARKELSKLKRN